MQKESGDNKRVGRAMKRCRVSSQYLLHPPLERCSNQRLEPVFIRTANSKRGDQEEEV